MNKHKLPLVLLLSLFPLFALASADSYDQQLCQLAQRLIINDDTNRNDYTLIEQRGSSNGFHTIQMAADGTRSTLSIASYYQTDDSNTIQAAACKMINRERANAILDLALEGPRRSCRDINQHTYQQALTLLSDAERQRYLRDGAQIVFAEDYIASTGGEWLPINVERENHYDAEQRILTIRAPSVQVPWNDSERNFFQGVHHCKLISKATLLNWMRRNSFAQQPELIAGQSGSCTAANQPATSPGSCLFYFAPTDSLFCKDYTGNNWRKETVQEECRQRHASKEALQSAKNRYQGKGGTYSSSPCADRSDVERIVSSCVFNCRANDEAVWHSTQILGNAAGAAMMSKACDLYIEQGSL